MTVTEKVIVPPRGGIYKAYTDIRKTGCVYGSKQQVTAWLEEISEYLATKDPNVLGAALLLEQAGFERSTVQLQLELGPSTNGE